MRRQCTLGNEKWAECAVRPTCSAPLPAGSGDVLKLALTPAPGYAFTSASGSGRGRRSCGDESHWESGDCSEPKCLGPEPDLGEYKLDVGVTHAAAHRLGR